VSFTIVNGNTNFGPNGPETAFSIDPLTAEIRMVSFISYENSTRNYQIGVNMTDNNPKGALTTYVVLNITILGTAVL
jgi:hypothetical protein